MLRSKQPRKSEAVLNLRGGKSRSKRECVVDFEALAEFRLQLRRFLAFSERNARRNGLTSQQYQALLTIQGLSRHHHMSVGQVAEFLLVKHHTAVELIGRMVKAGLLNRFRDSNDGRRILVTLTRKGQRRLCSVARVNWEELSSRRLAMPRMPKSPS